MTVDDSIRKFLDDLAARTPTPGGGSSSALIGAIGSALGSMAAIFTSGEKYKAAEPQAQALLKRFDALRVRMAALVDADIAAYQSYARASKLPRQTDAEKASRKAVLAQAMHETTTVPEQIVTAAVEGLELTASLAPICNPNLVSDAAVAAYALEAAGRGAGLQVLVNLRAADLPQAVERRRKVRNQLAACRRLCDVVETETIKMLKLPDDT